MTIWTSWKLKSREMKEGWMKNDEGWMKKDGGWMMEDDDLKLLRGFADGRTNEWTDICDCRVAFATENQPPFFVANVTILDAIAS